MCIIGYAPAGVKIEERTIKTMFSCNSDGAGIMWKPLEGGNVMIRKGFMKVEDLIEAYNEIPVECEKAIHCRIATSGKISIGCCHPFPVRIKTSMMKKTVDKCHMALMHNGVISPCAPLSGMKADYSDSMLFAAKFLYPLQKQLDKECVQELLESYTSSRLLIMRGGAETIMLGDWIKDEATGAYFSNSTYKDIGWGYCDWRATKSYSESNTGASWIVLDIGKTKPAKAIRRVEETLDNYDILYDYIDDCIEGELSFQSWGFPSNLTKIAGFKVVDRIDDEPEPHEDEWESFLKTDN